MATSTLRARAIIVALFVLGAFGCSYGIGNDPYYSYDYPWQYDNYGTYTYVRRPVYVVDGWTDRAFGYRPYSGYSVHRHNSNPIVYSATRSDETLEVNLTEMGDSTRVDVKARQGADKWDRERARRLMGAILKDYK